MKPTKTICSFFCFFIFCFISLQAQSPYKIDKSKSILLYSIGAGSIGISSYLHSQVEVLSVEQIAVLNRSSVNQFDRIATNFSSLKSKKMSDVFFYSSFAMPATFFLYKKTRSDFFTISLMYGEVVFINYGLTTLTKKSFLRSRPLVYNPNVDIHHKTERNARYSFFSGHASVVSSNCFFTAQVFSDYFPDSKWKPLVWGVAATAPAITGYLRVRAGKHYPSDVMAGYAVGALVGVLIPRFHKNLKKKIKKDITLSVMPSGGYFSMRF